MVVTKIHIFCAIQPVVMLILLLSLHILFLFFSSMLILQLGVGFSSFNFLSEFHYKWTLGTHKLRWDLLLLFIFKIFRNKTLYPFWRQYLLLGDVNFKFKENSGE